MPDNDPVAVPAPAENDAEDPAIRDAESSRNGNHASGDDVAVSRPNTDAWQRIDIVAKAFGSLLLPVVIFVLGQRYTAQQSRIEADRRQQELNADGRRRKQELDIVNEQHKIDRVEVFIKHLASPSEPERLFAVKTLQYLASNHQFPEELIPAVLDMVNDSSLRVRKAASATIASASKSDRELAKEVTKAAPSETIQRAAALDPDVGSALKDTIHFLTYPVAEDAVTLRVVASNADVVSSRLSVNGVPLAGDVWQLTLGKGSALADKRMVVTTFVSNFSSKTSKVTYTLSGGAAGDLSHTFTTTGSNTVLKLFIAFEPAVAK